MNKKVLIIVMLVFFISATQIFANTITYDKVHFSWGRNSLQLQNFNDSGVNVTFSVELVNPSDERDTKIESNIRYSIEAGGARTWTAPRTYIIREIRGIVVRVN